MHADGTIGTNGKKNRKIALNFQATVATLSFGPINEWIDLYINIMDGF